MKPKAFSIIFKMALICQKFSQTRLWAFKSYGNCETLSLYSEIESISRSWKETLKALQGKNQKTSFLQNQALIKNQIDQFLAETKPTILGTCCHFLTLTASFFSTTTKRSSTVCQLSVSLLHDGGHYHIETSPLICRANQCNGFYMITASVMKELSVCSENHSVYIGNLNDNITEKEEFVFQRESKSSSKGTDMLLQNGVIVESEDEEGEFTSLIILVRKSKDLYGMTLAKF